MMLHACQPLQHVQAHRGFESIAQLECVAAGIWKGKKRAGVLFEFEDGDSLWGDRVWLRAFVSFG